MGHKLFSFELELSFNHLTETTDINHVDCSDVGLENPTVVLAAELVLMTTTRLAPKKS